LSAYTVVPTGSKNTFQVNGTAAHDGSFGLAGRPGNDWIFRNDSTVHVQQGDELTVWIQFATAADGQVNFGFGATSTGTLSIVASPAAGVLQLQLNSSYSGGTVLGSVSQTYTANHWYRLEVDWGSTGSITGKLLDSDGITVLNTVTGSSTAITSGGIAFHATGTNTKYWDTVQRTPGLFTVKPPPGPPVQLAAALSYEMKLQHAGFDTHAFGPDDGDDGGDMAAVGALNPSSVDQFFAVHKSSTGSSTDQLFQVLGTL